MNFDLLRAECLLNNAKQDLMSLRKESRLHRMGCEDAYWLEREYETFRKYEKKYSDIVTQGFSGGERKRSDRVWVLWLQGMDKAPALVKACYNSLLEYLPDKCVTVLSENSMDDYINIPGYLHDKRKSGQIPMAQFSDLIRTNLIVNHGGTWIDSTVLLTGTELPHYTMDLPLFCFKQLNLSNKDISPIVASNWYISGHSNSKILGLTQNMLWEYWKTHDKLEHYFIFHIFFAIACNRFPDEWASVPLFNNATPHELMFELGSTYSPERWHQICRSTDIHKLSRHIEFGLNTNYQYIIDTWG